MHEILQQASVARERGRYGEALALLNALLATTPNTAALTERGRVYAALNNRELARADFDAASHADPSGSDGDAARAELLRLLAPPLGPTPPIIYRTKPKTRPMPNAWVRNVVVLFVVLSIACSLVSVIAFGRYPLRPPQSTTLPTRPTK